ncbi:hypothetical protein NVR11_03265 [Staphylococcus pseudintermedius]|nr:hypothetical protein [Staphylococcus pseudintermedius]ADV04536.1 hypothetical protein SPSINT_0007 [Staphylococcus pseudintermedius HKU10-03]ADX77703.1 hypothetical protein SPSE_2498 [Staphylococcus pseudintermedius ED99]MDA3114223.1 hypothetical protein [Staphylococcus pseudintermedius]MDT1108813.1 hypothetical protein [Staphylococcus pseudintermedius]
MTILLSVFVTNEVQNSQISKLGFLSIIMLIISVLYLVVYLMKIL